MSIALTAGAVRYLECAVRFIDFATRMPMESSMSVGEYRIRSAERSCRGWVPQDPPRTIRFVQSGGLEVPSRRMPTYDGVAQSAVHSPILPIMSWTPNALGLNDPTGALFT